MVIDELEQKVTQQVDILNHTVEDFSKTSNLLEQEQVKSTELTAKLKKRRVQVEAMTRQIGELSMELETMKEAFNTLSETLMAEQNEHEDLQKSHAQVLANLTRTEGLLEESTKEKHHFEEKYKDTFEQLKEEIKTHVDALTSLGKSERELKKTHSERKSFSDQHDEARSLLIHANLQLEKLKSELINKDNEFEQHKTDTTKGVEHRKKQFTRRLQEEVEAHEITRRRSEVLKEQVEARVSEMESLQEEMNIIRDVLYEEKTAHRNAVGQYRSERKSHKRTASMLFTEHEERKRISHAALVERQRHYHTQWNLQQEQHYRHVTRSKNKAIFNHLYHEFNNAMKQLDLTTQEKQKYMDQLEKFKSVARHADATAVNDQTCTIS